MRILWHGIGPWHKTGYGVQTALFAPLLRDLGHEVAIAFMGRKGTDDDPATAHPSARDALRAGNWEGIPVTGPGLTEFGMPSRLHVRAAFGGHDPDLVIVLKDAWILTPGDYARYPNVVVWANIDTTPLGVPDRRFFEAASHVIPASPSLHGQAAMRKAGLEHARYVPHGIDTAFWTPGDRAEARQLLGLSPRAFVAGINATNVGPRKAWGEQFEAFATLYHLERHLDPYLLCHTAPEHPEGINLRELAAFHGITDRVLFGSQVNMTAEQIRTWYRSLDVLMAATYGEGFGLPIVEALSCGVPVIAADSTAMTEKVKPHGNGWLVQCQPWWNQHHQSNWAIPRTREITAKLGRGDPSSPALRHQFAAERYDAGRIAAEYWKPLIEELTA